jgi:hypothetical protein
MQLNGGEFEDITQAYRGLFLIDKQESFATRWSMTFPWAAALMKHCVWWRRCSFLKKTGKFARPIGIRAMWG